MSEGEREVVDELAELGGEVAGEEVVEVLVDVEAMERGVLVAERSMGSANDFEIDSGESESRERDAGGRRSLSYSAAASSCLLGGVGKVGVLRREESSGLGVFGLCGAACCSSAVFNGLADRSAIVRLRSSVHTWNSVDMMLTVVGPSFGEVIS